VIHVGLAFFALWQRRTLKMKPLEALQYLLGFSIPLLAAMHVTGTRINDSLLGVQIPAHRGQSFRRIADSNPVIADSF
jgi:hypothetical protein